MKTTWNHSVRGGIVRLYYGSTLRHTLTIEGSDEFMTQLADCGDGVDLIRRWVEQLDRED